MNTRALGVDHGDVRIGLAAGDELGFMAHPLRTIPAAEGLQGILGAIEEINAATVVIGLPRNMDGSYGPAAEKVRNFAETVREKVTIPVVLWDERMTTLQAQRALHEAGRNTRQSRSVIDQVAAVAILQSWMDSQAPQME